MDNVCNRRLFSFPAKVEKAIASSKHEEGWENSRQLCKDVVEGLHYNPRVLR